MHFRVPQKGQWIPWSALAGVWILSFVYKGTPFQDMVLCVWRRVLDVNCPGCGLTRSFCAMSSGAFENAFDYNWAGPPLYFAMVWCVFVWAGRFATARPQLLAPPKFVMVGFWMGTGGLFLGQAVRTVFGWFSV